jgi:hypothetical protein
MKYDLEVLALGAGVQSMCVLLLAEAGDIPRPDCAIFADTQWEPPAVYEQLEWLRSQTTIPIHVVTGGNLKDDVLNSIGPPGEKITGHFGGPPFFVDGTDRGGMLWRKCTSDYKIQPIQKKIRTLLGYQPRQRVKKKVRQWFGISLDEAHRMRDSNVGWIDNYYPLVDLEMRRADCLSWMKKQGYPEPRKSACIGCPYHSSSTWAKMRRDYPDEFDDAVAFDTQLRTGKLPGVRGDAYLHRSMLPLAEAVDSTHNPDQATMEFGEECEGMCGL